MPLPKPSKMISKRFKKPKLAHPSISPPPPDLSKKPWPPALLAHPHPCRNWRIRVVCTDPDATDDSSSDEAEPSPSPSPSPFPPRKRLIHELCLPLPSPSSPSSSPQSLRARSPCRPTRSLCRDLVDRKSEVSAFPSVSNLCPPSLRTSLSPESVATEEEFTRFLMEFLPEQEDENLWECNIGLSASQQESSSLSEMLDLELDSEALSWINSMQRLP